MVNDFLMFSAYLGLMNWDLSDNVYGTRNPLLTTLEYVHFGRSLLFRSKVRDLGEEVRGSEGKGNSLSLCVSLFLLFKVSHS